MNGKLAAKINSVFNRILSITAVLGGTLIWFLMFSVCLEVGLRNFFGHPTSWVTEISGVILLYITFLAAAWVLKKEGHVKLDLVLDHLSPKTVSILSIITSGIALIICLIIVWFGVVVTWGHYQTDFRTMSVLRLPKWTLLIIIPFGSLLLAIQFIRRINNYLASWRTLRSKEQRT